MRYTMHVLPITKTTFYVAVYDNESETPQQPVATNSRMTANSPRECLDIYLTLLQHKAVAIRSVPMPVGGIEYHFNL